MRFSVDAALFRLLKTIGAQQLCVGHRQFFADRATVRKVCGKWLGKVTMKVSRFVIFS